MAQQRAAATTASGHVKSGQGIEIPDAGTYPAPLVLPGDDLALDPHYPPQSLRAWLRGKDRNKVTPERRTVYFVAPPDVDAGVEFVREWGRPRTAGGEGEGDVSPPTVSDIVKYLQAFYHGLPVRLLPPSGLKFAAWDEDPAPEPASKRAAKGTGTTKGKGRAKAEPYTKPTPKSTIPPFVALHTTTEAVGIRTRPLPATAPFPAQLNLDDLLDAAIAILPDDAYALLLLVDQDLFEGDDDEFVCGRAYGGSRVAVVSRARYAPSLDTAQGVARAHAWPASHCAASIAALCAASKPRRALPHPGEQEVEILDSRSTDRGSQMQAAVTAHLAVGDLAAERALSGLWLSRVYKTASHELGHCFGIDHCVYYACVMQGSASLAEDARQPPDVCPVEEAKLGRAVAEAAGKEGAGEEWMRVWRGERRERLREFCGEMEGEMQLWRAMGAWLGEGEGEGRGDL